MSLRAVSTFLIVCLASIASLAQNLAPPAPERITIHSNVLNEDRAILVRMPAAAQGKKDKYAVLYLADGDGHTPEHHLVPHTLRVGRTTAAPPA